MEKPIDSIETLLKNTGLSCDDLLQKLLAYRTSKELEPLSADSKESTSSVISESNVEKTDDNSESILDKNSRVDEKTDTVCEKSEIQNLHASDNLSASKTSELPKQSDLNSTKDDTNTSPKNINVSDTQSKSSSNNEKQILSKEKNSPNIITDDENKSIVKTKLDTVDSSKNESIEGNIGEEPDKVIHVEQNDENNSTSVNIEKEINDKFESDSKPSEDELTPKKDSDKNSSEILSTAVGIFDKPVEKLSKNEDFKEKNDEEDEVRNNGELDVDVVSITDESKSWEQKLKVQDQKSIIIDPQDNNSGEILKETEKVANPVEIIDESLQVQCDDTNTHKIEDKNRSEDCEKFPIPQKRKSISDELILKLKVETKETKVESDGNNQFKIKLRTDLFDNRANDETKSSKGLMNGSTQKNETSVVTKIKNRFWSLKSGLPFTIAQQTNTDSAEDLLPIEDTQPFSLSDETNFMILDVKGGVDWEDQDPKTNLSSTKLQNSNNTIILRKTDDITKVKGWEKKKFDVKQAKPMQIIPKYTKLVQTNRFEGEFVPFLKPYQAIFDGEIVLSTENNKDVVEKLGVETKSPFIRLLPWQNLLDNYHSGKIKIWCPLECPAGDYLQLLMNKSDENPPNGFIEISKTDKKTGIIPSILSQEFPNKGSTSSNLHVIISPRGKHYEILGIRSKNTDETVETKDSSSKNEKEESVTSISSLEKWENETLRPPQLRKTKTGFIRRKSHIESVPFEIIKNVEPLKPIDSTDLEKLRENIKNQLTSLRNRKRKNNVPEVQKTPSIDNLKLKYKKKVPSRTTSPPPLIPLIKKPETSSEEIQTSSVEKTEEEHKFFTTDDSDFVIVDVEGGVDDIDDNSKNSTILDTNRTSEEKQLNDKIKLTKTNDITKIKGWKKKQFAVDAKKQDATPNDVTYEDVESGEESFNASVKNEENSKGELSPFVSNTLEEFLTENSTLNISYQIPKLGAEDALNRTKYTDVVALPKFGQSSGTSKKKYSSTGFKPKTLAEKRRLLEKSMIKNKIPEVDGITPEKIPRSFRTSYILYNNKKYSLPSTSMNKCFANITHTAPKRKNIVKPTEVDLNLTKNTLLNFWQRKCSVKYKPGPLSMKSSLQNEQSKDFWETRIYELPKVLLEVVPEVQKPIPKHLLKFLPKFEPVINEKRLEYALTALKTKSENTEKKKCFQFHIPYANNQKYVLVKKEKERTFKNGPYEINPEKNSVESVMEDLLTYVENKEMENSIIKDPEPYLDDKSDPETPTSKNTETPTSKNSETPTSKDTETTTSKNTEAATSSNSETPSTNVQIKNRKPQPRGNKLENEIKRLSGKIVSVSLDEKDENLNCSKPFCKLGCICKSLACKPKLPLHCSKVDCMFKCSCSKGKFRENEISILSSDTVTRIEDLVKSNLAKEEKEFTHTLIRADNQTILIPSTSSSSNGRSKRAKKLPKRFSDYADHVSALLQTLPKEERECYVKLQKLDLKTVMPFCMEHCKYSCFCLAPRTENYTPKRKSEETVTKRKVEDTSSNDEYTPKYSKRRKSIMKRDDYVYSDVMENMEEIGYDLRESTKMEKCSRIYPVHTQYVQRNKCKLYKKHLEKKVRVWDPVFKIDMERKSSSKKDEKSSNHNFVDITTPLLLPANEYLKCVLNNADNCHKRKQVLEIRKDAESNMKIKIKKLKHAGESSIQSGEDICFQDGYDYQPYTSVFDGEIVISTEDNKEFVRKLGIKTVAPFMRLLPWLHLLDNYYNERIKIWCFPDMTQKLLMNEIGIKPPAGYVEIEKCSNNTNSIITWILNKKLPTKTLPDLVHLILTPMGGHYEISGICLKNTAAAVITKGVIGNGKEDGRHYQESNLMKRDDKIIEDFHNSPGNKAEKLSLSLVLKSVQNTCQMLQLGGEDEKSPMLRVRLPAIHADFRWRMVYLHSNFSYLLFTANNNSIKYKDLSYVLKQSQTLNQTVCATSPQLQEGYSHKDFGIFAVPEYKDRLFIGPYRLKENHGLETLRYLRQSLVSTSYFEMIHGGGANNEKDAWLMPKPQLKKQVCVSRNLLESPNKNVENFPYAEITPLPKKTSSISPKNASLFQSLQKESSERVNEKTTIENVNSSFMDTCEKFVTTKDLEDKSIIRFPQFALINGKKMFNFNRYIFTNIPNFGYLGAYQDEKVNWLEVNWPFANKILRFRNASIAKEVLIRRFTNLLLPVPSTFKISLVILTEIPPGKQTLIDPKALSGTYLCGEFGVMDSRKLTPELAKKYNTTPEMIVARLRKRAQYLVRSRLRTLGILILPIQQQLEGVFNTVANIIDLGALEVNKLKKQEAAFILTKKNLMVQKQKNVNKFMSLLNDLPEKQRQEEYDKFRRQCKGGIDSILKNTSTTNEDDIECIEIEDSDTENEVSSTKEISSKTDIQDTPTDQLSLLLSKTEEVSVQKDESAKLFEKIPDAAPGRLKMTIKNNKVIFPSTSNTNS